MASLLDYALTNTADVKETLGIASSDTSWDNLVIRKINQATEVIEGWCNRRFKETTYTDELYDATYDQALTLRQYPVTTTEPFVMKARTTTLNEDSFFTIDSDLYFIDRNAGIVDAVSSFWGSTNQWSVTYSAGYATIPSDLAEACVTLAAYMVANDPSQNAGIASKKEGNREIRFGNARFVTPDTPSDQVLFAELGILPTLQRYGSPALGNLR